MKQDSMSTVVVEKNAVGLVLYINIHLKIINNHTHQ